MYILQATLPASLRTSFQRIFTQKYPNYTPFYAECLVPRLDLTRPQAQIMIPSILTTRDLNGIIQVLRDIAPTQFTQSYWRVDGDIIE